MSGHRGDEVSHQFCTKPGTESKTGDDNLNEAVALDNSQQEEATRQKCPHGFEGCEAYTQRFYLVDKHTKVAWKKGDPEDKAVIRIDELELRMRAAGYPFGERKAWMELSRYRRSTLKSLETMLRARLDNAGERSLP